MDNYRNTLLPIAVLCFLLLFVAYPTCTVLVKSVQVGGQWSLSNFAKFLTHPYFIKLAGGSVLVALVSALCSTILGLVLALTIFKTALFGRRLFLIAVILPMIFPGFVTSLSYIFLFGRNGLITYQLFELTWEIYSWRSVVILQTLGFSTTTFFLIAAVLMRGDGQLEQASRNLGASEWEVLTTVTLPLLKPGISAAFLLSFLRSMADFGTPFIIGGRFNTLATTAYTKLIGAYDTEMASTTSVMLLLISLIGYWLYLKAEKKSNSVRITHSVQTNHPIKLPKVISGTFWFVCFLFSLLIFSLLLSILAAAFTKHLGAGMHFTWEHFAIIPQRGWNSIRNTIVFATVTCLAMTCLGIVTAYLVTRIDFPGKRWMDTLTTLPFAIPGTFIGLGYALAFNQFPFILTGTWTIVIVCTVVRELPLGFRSGVSVLSQQDRTIEQASENLGASKFGTFFRIILPLARPVLLVSAIYSFIATTKTLGAIIFLISPGNKVLAVDIFEATVRGDVGDAAAFSVVLMSITVTGVVLITLVSQKEKMGSLSGRWGSSQLFRSLKST